MQNRSLAGRFSMKQPRKSHIGLSYLQTLGGIGDGDMDVPRDRETQRPMHSSLWGQTIIEGTVSQVS